MTTPDIILTGLYFLIGIGFGVAIRQLHVARKRADEALRKLKSITSREEIPS